MSIENIGLQEITVVAGKEIPNQVAVQGDNAARGLSIKLLGSNHKIIKDPLIQVFWNYEIVGDDGVYTLDNPVEGMYKAGRYEIQYPSQLGAMSGVALAQVQFKQGNKTLFSIPYKIRVYKQVGVVGSSIPSGVINIFDKALADALEELNQMSKATKEYMVKTTADVEKAFKSEMQLIFNSLESDINELESLIAKWESESTEYLNNLKAEGDKAVADLHIQLDETAEQLIDELRVDLKIEYDKKQAEIDSITDDLILQKAELEKLQERITTNTNTIEQLTVDFESKINQHIIDSDNKIDSHLSLYEAKFTEYTTQSTDKIDQAIADMAGALDDDIERIVSEKVDEFADGLSERVNKTETDIVELETNKADRSELEGLAKETYVDEKIAAIPEVDLSDIKNDISTLEEKKADKEEIPKYGNDLKVSEGWEVPLGMVVEGLNNYKADKTEVEELSSNIALFNLVDKGNISFDSLKETGRYRAWHEASSPTKNKDDYILDVIGYHSSYVVQTAYNRSNGTIYHRRYTSSNWGEWEKLNKKADKTELTPINKEIDNLKSSGVESNRIMVEALNSKGVQASIDNSIRENANKINDISVGDYSIGDVCKRVEEVWDDNEELDKPEEVWTFDRNTGKVGTITTDGEGNVYSGAFNGVVKKISPSGSQIWTRSAHKNIVWSMAATYDGNTYSGGESGEIVSLSPSGSENWRNNESNSTLWTLIVNGNDGIYSGHNRGVVRKLSLSGEKVWSLNVTDDAVRSLAADNEGYIYLGDNSGVVKKLSSSGTEEWTLKLWGGTNWSLAVDNEGNIYVGTENRSLRQISPSGKEMWDISLDGAVHSISVSESRNIYAGTNNSTIRKLSPSGSTMYTIYKHSDRVTSLDLDSKGHLYSGSYDKTVKKYFVGLPPEIIGYRILE